MALATLGVAFAIILVSMGRRRFYGCLDAKTAGEGERLVPSVLMLTMGALLFSPAVGLASAWLMSIPILLGTSIASIIAIPALIFVSFAILIFYAARLLYAVSEQAADGKQISDKSRRSAVVNYTVSVALCFGMLAGLLFLMAMVMER